MKVDITNAFTNDGKEYYKWELHDGPDGVETVRGFATDLITAFSKVMEWHERIQTDYAAEFESDMDTLKNFIENNETL